MVVTKTGAVWEVISDFQAGVVVKNNSPKILAEGVRKLHSSYKEKQNGVKKYAKEADWNVSAKHHESVYKELLK